jgi:hypothetical protein
MKSKKKKRNPNPAGRAGKPISLAPLTFMQALTRLAKAPPPPGGWKSLGKK